MIVVRKENRDTDDEKTQKMPRTTQLTNIISVTLPQMRRITFLIFLKAFLCAFSLIIHIFLVFVICLRLVCVCMGPACTDVVQFNPKLHYKVNGYWKLMYYWEKIGRYVCPGVALSCMYVCVCNREHWLCFYSSFCQAIKNWRARESKLFPQITREAEIPEAPRPKNR